MNNDELNNQVPNNTDNNTELLKDYGNMLEKQRSEVSTDLPASVAPPVVLTPFSNNTTDNEIPVLAKDEDSRILKPIVQEVEVLEDGSQIATPPIDNTPSNPPSIEQPIPQQTVVDQSNNVVQNVLPTGNSQLKLKKEYKGPGFFKIFFMLLIFAGLFSIVYYLPEIAQYLENRQGNGEQVDIPDEKITSGILSCNLNTNDDKFDFIYTYEFHFDNNMLDGLDFVNTLKGDRTIDSEELESLYTNCKTLSTELMDLQGIVLSCDLYDGTLNRTQNLDYSLLDIENVKEIYKKYDMDFPKYEKKQNIDDIELEMNSNGYTCERNRD